MNYLLTLLQNWTDPAGTAFKTGDTVELTDKKLYGEMLADGIGEKAESKAINDPALDEATTKAISDAVKGFLEENKSTLAANKHVHIEVHDKSDDDSTWGYCPERQRKHTKDELTCGLGEFAKDVFEAGVKGGTAPLRLQACHDRGQKIIDDAIEKGFVTKATGDVQQVGVDSDGGFTVPTEFSLMLNEAALEFAVIRPSATIIQIGSDSIELPQPKNYDHSSNLVYGGVQTYWKGEDATLTESKVTWEEIRLNLNALTAMAKVTHKMMRFSAIAVGSFILPKLADAMGWKEDDGFINGTGAGMPLGLLNSPSKVEVAAEGGQTAATVVSENIDKMFGQFRRRGTDGVKWLYNHTDLWDDLASLERAVGTAGGSAAGLVQQLANSPQMSIYGLPLVDTEHCPAAGTPGDMILVDCKDYLIADDRRGPEIAQSMHLHFDTGKEVFRIIKYTDGQPRYSAPFTRQKSTNTWAPTVTIAAR